MRLAEKGWLVALLVLLCGMYLTRTNQILGWLVSGTGIAVQLAFRAYADVLLNHFRCPRCGASFMHIDYYSRMPLQGYSVKAPCAKCGLPLGATSENYDRAL